MEKIRIYLIGAEAFSNDKSAFDLNSSQGFGKKDGEKVSYMLEEAFYLYNKKGVMVFDGKLKEISKENLIKKVNKLNPKFQKRYRVYEELRDKGYLLKEGFKFGADFRIYQRNSSQKTHSKWLCICLDKRDKFSWLDFGSKNRIANTTNKGLIFAFIDDEKEVTYYETKWAKKL